MDNDWFIHQLLWKKVVDNFHNDTRLIITQTFSLSFNIYKYFFMNKITEKIKLIIHILNNCFNPINTIWYKRLYLIWDNWLLSISLLLFFDFNINTSSWFIVDWQIFDIISKGGIYVSWWAAHFIIHTCIEGGFRCVFEKPHK